jgi:hypothetical protein
MGANRRQARSCIGVILSADQRVNQEDGGDLPGICRMEHDANRQGLTQSMFSFIPKPRPKPPSLSLFSP